MINKKRQVS